MTFRHSLLLGTALVCLTGAAEAQQRRSREDLLDALTRHIQICAEISDAQARLGCYDKLQTQVGDVQAPAPSPTPHANNPPPPPAAGMPTTGGSQIGAAPLAPPPLMVPGGGPATLGGPPGGPTVAGPAGPGGPAPLAPPITDPDRAFDPRDATTAYRPPEGPMPRPQPVVRRTGPRPVPNYPSGTPVLSLQASNLTYGSSRYWQVTVTLTSNVNRTVDTQVQCSFLNAGRSVGEANFGPIQLAPGEQVSTDLVGPPTTAFVDSTNCRVVNY
jgi:hypothetical protein